MLPFKMVKRVLDAFFVPSFTLLSFVLVKQIIKVLKEIREEEEINVHLDSVTPCLLLLLPSSPKISQTLSDLRDSEQKRF